MGYEVVHLVEYVAQQVKDNVLNLNNRVEMKATYHDPCNLGRLSEPWINWEGDRKKYGLTEPPKPMRRGTFGVYDAPRDILESIPGLELVEMIRMKENALCCGVGGGVEEAFGDFASWTADERLTEAEAVGAEAIISCCPRCKDNFSRSAASSDESVKIYDISEIILESISSGG